MSAIFPLLIIGGLIVGGLFGLVGILYLVVKVKQGREIAKLKGDKQ
jgi:uncharacterized membrane protein YciS (DUF1049 family)